METTTTAQLREQIEQDKRDIQCVIDEQRMIAYGLTPAEYYTNSLEVIEREREGK